jgi:hypothetical protein
MEANRMKKSLWGLVLVSALSLSLVGCGGEEDGAASAQGASAEAEPSRATEGSETAEAEDTGAAAGPVAEDPTFELRAEAQGPYAAGEPGTFEIRLTPRGAYHVNQEFPMNVALSGPGGVELPEADLGNDDAEELSEERARFSVPFTAALAGEHRVTAEVDFAVCTPEACMPDRRTLALVLPVR